MAVTTYKEYDQEINKAPIKPDGNQHQSASNGTHGGGETLSLIPHMPDLSRILGILVQGDP